MRNRNYIKVGPVRIHRRQRSAPFGFEYHRGNGRKGTHWVNIWWGSRHHHQWWAASIYINLPT